MIRLDNLFRPNRVAELEKGNGHDHTAVQNKRETDEGEVNVIITRPPPGSKDEYGAVISLAVHRETSLKYLL